LTLIASLRCTDGLILAADTEEVIEEAPLLKTRREKLRILDIPIISNCRIVAGGAGEFDYIRMMGDFIEDKIAECGVLVPRQRDIEKCIRSAIADVWRDHARHEGRAIPVQIMIAIRAEDHPSPQLMIVNGASVRRGTDIEAIGRGDATFKALADRFIQHGMLSTVSANLSAARVFMVYAFLQAKLSIPGIGGNTRIVALTDSGDLKYMKSWSVSAIQRFFNAFDQNIRTGVQSLSHELLLDDPVEQLLVAVGQETIKEYKELRKELRRIEEDESLV
jgi:hypothetical protein